MYIPRPSAPDDLQKKELETRFYNDVFPILTPLAIDPGHPFPHVRNKSLNLGVMFSREGETEPGFGVVQPNGTIRVTRRVQWQRPQASRWVRRLASV